MTYYLDLYNDVNAAYLTGATDVVVVRQKDGSLKSTPFHVRFGKLGVLRTGDLKEVEIEVNGSLVDMTMNIDETGKVFYTRAREGSDEEHVIIDMSPGLQSSAQSGDEQESGAVEDDQNGEFVTPSSDPPPLGSHVPQPEPNPPSHPAVSTSDFGPPAPPGLTPSATSSPIPTPSTPRRSHTASSVPDSPAIIIDPISSEELMSSSLLYNLEVLSDSALDTGTDRADGEELDARPMALSDTELEINERHSSWMQGSVRRKEVSTKGEASRAASTSDEELKERLKQHKAMPTGETDRSGIWYALTRILKRRHSRRFSSIEDGIYLDDIDYDSMDPQELSKFFPSNTAPPQEPVGPPGTVDASGPPSTSQLEPTMGSSGLGSSPALSPAHSIGDIQKEGVKDNLAQLIMTLDGVAFSLCGGLAQGTVSEDTFQNSFVSYSSFCGDPVGMLSNPNLVVRVNGKYYTWQVAAPLIMSAIVYLQVMPQKVQSKVTDKYMPKKYVGRQSFWNFWGRGQKEEPEERAKSEGATPMGSPQKWSSSERRDQSPGAESRGAGEEEKAGEREESEVPVVSGGEVGERLSGVVLSTDEESEGGGREIAKRPRQRSKRSKKIGFTNVLTSEQLESLNLKDGANKVVFSITTKFQGTAKANCTVYLWNYNDKIVVSDIDGTITRSDVAGQVLPLLGMDWTQNGVVELFTAISKNGYNIIYLSARAIGQAGYTKEFLRKVRRGSCCLPDGPLFLFPFSLYKAFRKEVIERRPEEFKITCLKQVRALFPEESCPMHAGFGNRDNDVKSYMNVGIPESRIFTVNHKGILRHELSVTFQSSYSSLTDIVDSQFPPLRCRLPSLDLLSGQACPLEQDTKEEYNTFNYWRLPIDVELPFDVT